MAKYLNTTLRSNDWELYFTSPTYIECLVIFIILFYGLRIQIQKLNHQRYINLIKEFEKSIMQILVTLVDWCTFMLFWHERFLLCRILRLQVDLEKETISILSHVFDGI